MIPATAGRGNASAGQIIHHDPRGYGRVQGFRAAAHRQAEPVSRGRFDRIGNPVALIADNQHKGRSDSAPLIEGISVQLS